jgi:hypothetical protein
VVAHTRTPARPHRLRPLGEPRPVAVEADGERRPVAVTLRAGERLRVAEVQDVWRIDDEWWRERPVSRMYYAVLLEDGRTLIAYRNLVNDRWFKQAYR